jgi:hypothetical protein
MASKGKGDSLTFGGWTTTKGLLTIGLFLALAFIAEFFMISFFAGSGLTETYALPVSPLFHILPLAVIVVLVSSWMYVTNHIVTRPHKTSPVKVSKNRRRHQKRASKSVFSKISSIFSSSSVSSAPQRRSFDRLALESTVTVLTVFLLAIILLAVLLYPNIFTKFAVGFYSETSALQGFMKAFGDVMVSVARVFDGVAPGFRSVFEGIVSTNLPSLASGDILWRYVLCQNVAAWVSAFAALVYVKGFSNPYHSRK